MTEAHTKGLAIVLHSWSYDRVYHAPSLAVAAQGSMVFTLGSDNAREAVDLLLEKLPPIVERLRHMSPLVVSGPGP